MAMPPKVAMFAADPLMGAVVKASLAATAPEDTVIVKEPVTAPPPLLVALTVKVKAPFVLGVPERTPPDDSVRPVGIEPLATAKVMGVVPEAVNV